MIIEPQEWIVKWENGNTKRFVPYDSLGMNAFIVNGLKLGKVTVNEREVVEKIITTWEYK